ncbi:MAG: NDP-sugar synthase [Acidobacteriota bacterium]
MKALILAGGEGTRLRPLTLATPKPVVPVVNTPFLCYQIELLRKHGIEEVVLSLSYQPHKIESILGDGSRFGVRIHYVVEASPLGTAGAFKNAEPLLNEATIVFNGDILAELDLQAVIDSHRRRKAVATLVLKRVSNPTAYGLVETESDGSVCRFLEKPGANEITCDTINAGTYILEPEVLQFVPPGQNYSFERGVFPSLLRHHKPVSSWVSEGYWIDIGTPQKYLQVHQDILSRQFQPVLTPFRHRAVSLEQVEIDERSVLAPGVQTGKDVRIVASCLGEGCMVGDQALIDRSVLWPGVTVGEHARLEGCIVGRGCKIGRHAVLSPGVVLGDDSVVGDFSLLPGSGGTPRDV